MKKAIFLLCCGIATLCSTSANAQSATTLRSQRDSLEVLYKFTLDKYDSVAVANMDLNKKLEQKGSEIRNLKNEIDNILKQKKEHTAELDKAKKIITDLAATVDKLEAEVKRLSNQKKPANNQQ